MDIPSQKDTEIPIVRPTVPILGEGVDPIIEDLLQRESVALKTKAAVPIASYCFDE